MRALKLSEDLKPLSEIKSKAGDVVRQVQDTGRPVVITKHGKGVAVIVSLEEFERLRLLDQASRMAREIRAAERAVSDGRVVDHEDAKARLERRIKQLGGS